MFVEYALSTVGSIYKLKVSCGIACVLWKLITVSGQNMLIAFDKHPGIVKGSVCQSIYLINSQSIKKIFLGYVTLFSY